MTLCLRRRALVFGALWTLGGCVSSEPRSGRAPGPGDAGRATSVIYKGSYMRRVSVYVPKQYVPGTPAPLMVTQDAMGRDVLPNVLDNLIDAKKLPKIVVFFVDNGGGDAVGSERGLEYDTVS